MGILDLDISFQADSHKFIYPIQGNCPMFNSDRDLDVNPNRQVAKSRGQSLSTGVQRGESQEYPPLVTELSIEQSKAIPIFTTATAQAVRIAGAPVSILTAIGTSGCQIGAIAGLEHFTHLPTQPNLQIELAGLEYCHDRSIGSKSSFVVTNCQKHPHLAQSSLCQVHGVRAYLGVPIVTASDDRLGTLAILDFKPRQFSDRDIEILQLISRLVASEFERKLLSQAQLNRWIGDLRYRAIAGFDDLLAASEHSGIGVKSITDIDLEAPSREISSPVEDFRSVDPQVQGETQFKLLTHLAQEFRTPLTSVLGMASVLQQEIYGPLSVKQKDYLEIIHHSGLQLVTIVDEIAQLVGFVGVGAGALNEPSGQHQLNLKSVDLEMLCQLAIQSLEPLARKKQQQIVLNCAGSNVPLETLTGRIWLLDKDKVRQIIYYLCLSLIHTSAIDRQISIQFAKIADVLQIQITTNDPQVKLKDRHLANPLESVITRSTYQDRNYTTEHNPDRDLRISLGLSLSHDLAVAHGGKIEIIAKGSGYQLTLPLIIAD
jgi:signal transduction histidine kinase